MPFFDAAFKKSFYKNIWVVIGVSLIAIAWVIEKISIQNQQKEIASKRFLWEQYRNDKNINSLLVSKYETMRLIDDETAAMKKENSKQTDINVLL